MNIAVLLCTKNGELFIHDQLCSIRDQDFGKIDLYILENKSSDSTLEKINEFSNKNKNINIHIRVGFDSHFANSYLELAKMIPNKYEYYAFCDQDDIWLENHIRRGVISLQSIGNQKASLFCSRTSLINETGNIIGKSQKFSKNPSFRNALVQSIAGANTMIFNEKAFNLFLMACPKREIVSHDWLLYIFVSGAGGHILYNQKPSVLYRQHDRNLIGTNKGILNKLKRFLMILRGTYRKYNMQNFYQIDRFDLLTKENEKIYKLYKEALKGMSLHKIKKLLSSGVYRQTFFGQIALVLSIFIKSRNEIEDQNEIF